MRLMYGPYIQITNVFLLTSSQVEALFGAFHPWDKRSTARCFGTWQGGDVWAFKEGAFEEMGVTCLGGGLSCVREGKRRVIFWRFASGDVMGVASQTRGSLLWCWCQYQGSHPQVSVLVSGEWPIRCRCRCRATWRPLC